jgi:hypothetical protein
MTRGEKWGAIVPPGTSKQAQQEASQVLAHCYRKEHFMDEGLRARVVAAGGVMFKMRAGCGLRVVQEHWHAVVNTCATYRWATAACCCSCCSYAVGASCSGLKGVEHGWTAAECVVCMHEASLVHHQRWPRRSACCCQHLVSGRHYARCDHTRATCCCP